MAYINQTEKKELSVGIKAVLKKYGMKGTIGIYHHSTLVVNLKSGKLDIIGNWFDTVSKKGTINDYGDKLDKPEYIQVNEYWIDHNYTGKVKDFLNELVSAMKKEGWRNNTDIQSDYFDISYYTTINVGKWNQNYTLEV